MKLGSVGLYTHLFRVESTYTSREEPGSLGRDQELVRCWCRHSVEHLFHTMSYLVRTYYQLLYLYGMQRLGTPNEEHRET